MYLYNLFLHSLLHTVVSETMGIFCSTITQSSSAMPYFLIIMNVSHSFIKNKILCIWGCNMFMDLTCLLPLMSLVSEIRSRFFYPHPTLSHPAFTFSTSALELTLFLCCLILERIFVEFPAWIPPCLNCFHWEKPVLARYSVVVVFSNFSHIHVKKAFTVLNFSRQLQWL